MEDNRNTGCLLNSVIMICAFLGIFFLAIEGMKAFGKKYADDPEDVIGILFLVAIGGIIIRFLIKNT